jgi:non-heme chloroperoxidase
VFSGIKADRPAAMMEFLKNFYSAGGADGKLFSDLVIQAKWIVAIGASPVGTLACVDAWLEDSLSDAAHMDERSTARACSDHLYA